MTVVSFTTIPERLRHETFVEKCKLIQAACEGIEKCVVQVNIPKYTMKGDEYVIPPAISGMESRAFRVFTPKADYGPITKLFGALENPAVPNSAFVVICDDDIPYKPKFVRLLLDSHHKYQGRYLHCMCNHNIEGFKAFGFRKELLLPAIRSGIPSTCVRIDDNYIHEMCVKLGIMTIAVPYESDESSQCSFDVEQHDREEREIDWPRLKTDRREEILPACIADIGMMQVDSCHQPKK